VASKSDSVPLIRQLLCSSLCSAQSLQFCSRCAALGLLSIYNEFPSSIAKSWKHLPKRLSLIRAASYDTMLIEIYPRAYSHLFIAPFPFPLRADR
jgi:hypothetical protein